MGHRAGVGHVRGCGIVTESVQIRVSPLRVVTGECVGAVIHGPCVRRVGITVLVSIGTAETVDGRVALLQGAEVTVCAVSIVTVAILVGVTPLRHIQGILVLGVRPTVAIGVDAA